MNSPKNEVVVSSRVRLARNYHDIPFSNARHPANAQLCIDRAKEAFEHGEPLSRYQLHTLAKMSANERTALLEQHLISRDLLQNSSSGTDKGAAKPAAEAAARGTARGAAFVRSDRAVSVMVNEEDHLRIQAMLVGLNLEAAATLAFQVEELLQNVCPFSFDAQLGYLTACPTNTGTGMRASLMLHLPLLTRFKQMGNVTQSVAKLGLTIRGIYGEGSEALGDLYQVSNQVTLGRTEKEIIESVIAVGNQLIDMEDTLRNRVIGEASLNLKDRIFRSYGILRHAMQMDADEFMQHWSSLRLGASLALLPVCLETADELLTIAQDAHVKLYRSRKNSTATVDQARMEIIRNQLVSKPQEV